MIALCRKKDWKETVKSKKVYIVESETSLVELDKTADVEYDLTDISGHEILGTLFTGIAVFPSFAIWQKWCIEEPSFCLLPFGSKVVFSFRSDSYFSSFFSIFKRHLSIFHTRQRHCRLCRPQYLLGELLIWFNYDTYFLFYLINKMFIKRS